MVVVTADADVASSLKQESVNVLTGDPTDEAVLREAGVGAASGVVAGSNDDAENVLAVLAARNVDPGVRVVAVANERKHVAKLEAVGTDEVISPRGIGGRLLGRSVLADEDDPSPLETLEEDGYSPPDAPNEDASKSE